MEIVYLLSKIMRVIEIKGAKFQIYPSLSKLDFPGGSDGKASACNAGNLGLIPGLGRRPGLGHGKPLQYSCLENPHGQKDLAC